MLVLELGAGLLRAPLNFPFPARAVAPCDIEIQGADEHREGNIPWGIDGVYKMSGCFSGYPVYKRAGKTRLRALLTPFHPLRYHQEAW